MSMVTVKELDQLVEQLRTREAEKDELELKLKEKNKEIALLENRATDVLRSLEREDYDSPYGKITIAEIIQVKQPADENKHLLWDWMKEKGIFERYAQVHATALKSLFVAEREAAITRGEDPITFTLPGMEPATTFEKLKFKAKK